MIYENQHNSIKRDNRQQNVDTINKCMHKITVHHQTQKDNLSQLQKFCHTIHSVDSEVKTCERP